jgi:hypothetical protein
MDNALHSIQITVNPDKFFFVPFILSDKENYRYTPTNTVISCGSILEARDNLTQFMQKKFG